MPDWAIVLVAAFGGGLAGAVLRPAVEYLLDKLRLKERIRKTRERQLRRMIVAEVARGRDVAFAALEAAHSAFRIRAMSREEGARPGVPREGAPLWQPERISDRKLQELVCQYHDIVNDLWFRVFFGKKTDAKNLVELVGELETLQPQITLRMDELNWPEVDE